MKKIIKYLVLIAIPTIFIVNNNVYGIDFSVINNRETSCPVSNINDVVYIPNGVNSYTTKIFDTFWATTDKYIANAGTLAKLWQPTSGLVSCSTWNRYSEVAPGNNTKVVAFASDCTFNKINTTNKNVQFVFNVRHGDIGGGTATVNKQYYTLTGWFHNPSSISYKTYNNYFVSNYKLDGNECYNIRIAWCGDGFLDTSHGEICDDGNNINGDGCSATCQRETVPICNSLTVYPNSGNTPLTSAFNCSATNATSYKIEVYSGSTIINTINSSAGSYTFTNTGSYTARCTINGSITSVACQKPIIVGGTTPTPNINIDKRDANPADLDGVVGNDTQTVNVSSGAVFRIRVTNNFTESLKNLVLIDAVAPNCAGNITLPGTRPSTWSSFTMGGSGNHANNTLEPGEYFEYICSRANTTLGYTNSATVNGIGEHSGLPVTDTDTTVVLIPGGPVPNIAIDKTDANPADLDGVVGNDTQRVNVGSPAIFRIRGTNNFTENLRNIVFTDSVAPNCSGSVTLPSTFPSIWSNVTVSGSGNHTNTILEVGEYIDYTCNGINTVVGYTNSATVNGIGVTSGLPVTDTDTTVVTIPGGTGGSQPDCVRIELSQSGSTANNTYPIGTPVGVTCIGSANTEIVKVECGDGTTATQNNTRIGNFTCTFNSLATFNPKCYVGNGATSGIPNVTSPTCNIKLSSGGGGGGGGGKGFCGDGVIQRPNDQGVNEVCEASLVGGILKFPSWCVDCKTRNYTTPGEGGMILTYPGGGNIFLRPYGQVIIGAGSNPFTVFGSTPYIGNDSGEELYLDYPLCVYNTDSSVLLNSNNNTPFSGICSAQKIGWLRPGISKTFEELNYGNKIKIKGLKITDNTSFKDTILKTTLQGFPVAFFATPLKVRVSKPAVATVGGGTSLIKNSNITADINKVASDGYSNQNKNKNFVGAGVSTGSTSSYSKNVTVTNISSGQTQKVEKNLTKVTTTASIINKNIGDPLTKYNGLSNVFIVKGSLTINTSIPGTGARTYIIEGGDLIINTNITYTDNIAFVVKGGGNIKIASYVTQINGTFIVIGGKIISEETDNKLLINGSLYGDIGDLVNHRTYIENKNDLINVGTVVSFGSNLFRKQAPLVGDFIGEYIASKKVAK